MVVIEYLNHSWCRISSNKFNVLRKVSNKFAIKYKNSSFMRKNRPNFSGKYNFIDNNNFFPSGLLYRVVKYLNDENIPWKIKDSYNKRKKIIDNSFKYTFNLRHPKLGDIKLYNFQKEAVKRALNWCRGIINVATNGGKTEIIASIIKNLLNVDPNFTIVLIVPSLQLLKDTGDRVSYALNKKCNVYHGKNKKLKQLNVTTVQTFYSEHKSSKKDHWKKVDAFIVDEIHVISGSNKWFRVLQNNFTGAKVRIGMTGTVNVDDPIKEFMFESLTAPVIHKITNKQLIDIGQSSKATVHFFDINIPIPHRMSYQEEVKYVFNNNLFLTSFIGKVNELDRRDSGGNMILVSNIDHGKDINRYLKDSIFISGVDKVAKRNKVLKEWGNGKYKTLIATQIFRFGLDTHHIKRLFLLSLGSKTSKVLQEIGRGLRKNEFGKVEIYFVRFTGTKYLGSFASKQAKICEKEGFEVVYDN